MDTDLRARAKEFASKDPFPLQGFSHLEWWVGNAYQSTMFLRNLLGFSIVGYRGPETGVAETSSYLVESGAIRFIVTGAQVPEHPVAEHVLLHGPGVKDVAFLVPDAEGAFQLALDRGAEVAYKPFVTENDRGRELPAASRPTEIPFIRSSSATACSLTSNLATTPSRSRRGCTASTMWWPTSRT